MRFTSIRLILPLMIVVPLVLTAGVLEWLSFKGGKEAIDSMSVTLGGNLIERSRSRIVSYLDVPWLNLQTHATAVRSGNLDLGRNCQQIAQEDLCLEELANFLLGQVLAGSSIESMLFASPVGLYSNLKQADSGFTLDQGRAIDNTIVVQTYQLGTEGNSPPEKTGEPREFDPRTRPWYTDALESNDPVLGELYKFASGVWGFTASVALYDPAGEFLGVLAVDIPIDQLRNNLEAISKAVNPKAELYVRQIGSSDPLIPSQEPRPFDEWVNNNFECSGTCEGVNIVTILKEPNLVATAPLRQERDWLPNWVAIAIVPQAEFVGSLQDSAIQTLVLAIVLVVVAAVLGVIASTRWIATPIARLGKAASDIEADAFDPDSLKDLSSRSDELGELAQLFQEMGLTISDNISGFKDEIEHLNQEFAKEKKRNAIQGTAQYQALLHRARSLRQRQNE